MALTKNQLKEINISTNTKIAIIKGEFNDNITDGLLEGAWKILKKYGFTESRVDVFVVPGAFEMPLASLKCIETKKYQGVICLGAVIRGDTSHFDYVCDAVTRGLTEVNIKTKVPVAFGVLTVDHQDQAIKRSLNDDFNKGGEAALALLQMIELIDRIDG